MMNEHESTRKALALIAAELHIQNQISIAIDSGFNPGYPYASDETIKKLADHFQSFFEGGGFFPGSSIKLTPMRGR
jgi:hypothetical protein